MHSRRATWLLAVVALLFFAVDAVFGMRTLGLRFASAGTLITLLGVLLLDGMAVWLTRFDRVGLAHLLEKSYPELAERLVTLAQPHDGASTDMRELLEAQTARQLAAVEVSQVCTLRSEAGYWSATLGSLALVGAFLAFTTSFGERFLCCWHAPLEPFAIHVASNAQYVLQGANVPVEASIQMLDVRADEPSQCELVCEYESGIVVKMPMMWSNERFVAFLEDLRQPATCRVEADGVASESFQIGVVKAPTLVEPPTIRVTPPDYSDGKSRDSALLQFSKINVAFTLDRRPSDAKLRIDSGEGSTFLSVPSALGAREGQNCPTYEVEIIAMNVGKFRAELALTLEHGLTTTIPLERWTIREDLPPRFVKSVRLQGASTALSTGREQRIAPDDLLRLVTELQDDEGIGEILLEYRVNDGAPRSQRWLHGGGKRAFVVNHWLALPRDLKLDDRVQFRVHVQDNRKLKKDAVAGNVPASDLLPQRTTFPDGGAEGTWITLRVDPAVGNFVKDAVQAQAMDVADVVAKLKKKLQSEIDQAQALQRAIHLQTALTLPQRKQAESIQKLNSEIVADLNAAGDRLVTNAALATLAVHFFDIADVEMKKSDDSLGRFRERDRPLVEAEKELAVVNETLLQAMKKLDRLLDWNKIVSEDRLDQFALEKLQKRQEELAQRLKNAQQQPLSEVELAKEIEAIRNEQAKLAAETAQLQQKSQLVQDSLAALEQMRVQRLAEEASRIAAEQRAFSELNPETMPKELKERLAHLARRQGELADRAQPFAKANDGPDAKPAADAANALKKPQLDEAIHDQKEHEKRLGDWLGKLLPGVAVNKLREEVLRLAKTQEVIRADLQKLGSDLPSLNEKMLVDRLGSLVKRQRALHAAIDKLAIDKKDVAELKNSAASTVKTAADQLAAKDTLQSFESMEKAEQLLKTLAAGMPQTLPVERSQIKDVATQKKIEQVEQFGKEQVKLREDTERLLADWLKESAHAKNPVAEKMQKLANDLLELSQKASSPEAKAMAKESMQAIDDANKSMEASNAMKAKGEGSAAKKMEDDAAKKMELAVKQLEKLVQDQAMKKTPGDDAASTAESLEQSRDAMKKAEANLPKMPKDAEAAMQLAAQKLANAANQANKQASQRLPVPPARTPAARAPMNGKGANPLAVLKNVPLDESIGKAWGQLPGELKTQMLQDFRARFGEDYAEMIRQYFDRLAETPKTPE